MKESLTKKLLVQYALTIAFAAARFYYQPRAVIAGFALSALLRQAGATWQSEAVKVEVYFGNFIVYAVSPLSSNFLTGQAIYILIKNEVTALHRHAGLGPASGIVSGNQLYKLLSDLKTEFFSAKPE